MTLEEIGKSLHWWDNTTYRTDTSDIAATSNQVGCLYFFPYSHLHGMQAYICWNQGLHHHRGCEKAISLFVRMKVQNSHKSPDCKLYVPLKRKNKKTPQKTWKKHFCSLFAFPCPNMTMETIIWCLNLGSESLHTFILIGTFISVKGTARVPDKIRNWGQQNAVL